MSSLRPAHPDTLDIAISLDLLTLPQLQVAEALAALGPSVPLASLTCLLVGKVVDARVAAVVDQLAVAGLCRVESASAHPAAGLRAAFGRPLGLGAPLAEVLAASYADDVRRMARQLGLPALGRKEATLGPVLAAMLEPGAIQAILATAPDGVIDRMIGLAWCEDEPSPQEDEYSWDSELRSLPRYRDEFPGPSRWGLGNDHAWARERGLVMSRRADGRPDVPAEVAMVLRGQDYRAPFVPERPVVVLGQPGDEPGRSVDLIDTVTGQFWLRLTGLCVALLAEIDSKPLPRRRSGELNEAEVKRLGATLHATTEEIRVLLALAKTGGLILADAAGDDDDHRLADWLDAETPERAAILAHQIGVLSRPLPDGSVAVTRTYSWSKPERSTNVTHLRRSILGILAELPPGGCTQLETLEEVVRWDAPRAAGPDVDALESLWREATSTCLIVGGSLSSVGRALAAGDLSQLTAAFASLMPAVVDEVSVTADLTATSTGLPSRRVSRVLDSMAEREREDAATVWRFTGSSVRRAFDLGGTEATVLADLTSVARTPLPDVLTRLIADIARRHGHLTVTPVGAVISSTDETLLMELQRSPGLGELELRRLAPGMLVAVVSHDATLRVLQDGGYLPVSALRASVKGSVAATREERAGALSACAPRETSVAT